MSEWVKSLFNAWPMLLLMTYALISSSWSIWSSVSIYETIWQYILLVYASVLVTSAGRIDIQKISKQLVMVWLVIVGLSVLVFDYAAGRIIEVKGLYPHKNNLGIISAFVFLVGLSTLEKNKITKIMLFGVLFILISSLSKTSMALVCFILLTYGLMNIAKKIMNKRITDILFKAIGTCAFLALIWLLSNQEQFLNFIFNNLPDEALTGRGRLWIVMLEHAYDRTLFGLGYGSVWGLGEYSEIQFTELIKTSPLWVEQLAASDGGYVDIILSLGFVGLFIFMLIIGWYYWNLRNLFLAGVNNKLVFALYSCGTLFVLHNITETTVLLANNLLWLGFITCLIVLRKESTLLLDKDRDYD
ncbi:MULTISPECIES: O-antigen ligase family protein [unclassified Endozoicomonas]|uniref:O-antigen ligase family protein n=1 Tax=unclassified Endozoicomonas TaxID=2644528 RepID=UPI003BB6065C